MRSDRRRLFQSTLLQEERHVSCSLLLEMWSISIHAPTRGATPYYDEIRKENLFQSTLLQEERRMRLFGISLLRIFQSTLLQEERRYRSRSNGRHKSISIHAPTRGATQRPMFPQNWKIYFNPRSYKRSDQSGKTKSPVSSISIHAPTRGATAKMHNIPYASLQ